MFREAKRIWPKPHSFASVKRVSILAEKRQIQSYYSELVCTLFFILGGKSVNEIRLTLKCLR